MRVLDDKDVLLCVGGGIAAYKACELVRALQAAGARVQVAMTPAAAKFVTPLTLQSLSRNPVATDLLSASEDATIGHIRIAQTADLVLVAPATADLIARMAHGMADDVVTAALLATTVPVVVAPAMNTAMLEHPAVRANLATLREYGHRVIEPDSGELACGTEGPGRLPDADVLLFEAAAALTAQDLRGWRFLISAGPTCEPIDPVRHVSNRSSGKMGYALAAGARLRGAEVTLVSGPTALPVPRGCELVSIKTAAQLADAMKARVTAADAVVMVAAVADYRPAAVAESKIKKGASSLSLELEKTEDILAALAGARGERVLVGFAAETNSVEENAKAKLRAKGLDLIVANDVSRSDAGFDVDANAALIISADGTSIDSGLVSKEALAGLVLDRIVEVGGRAERVAGRRVRG